MAGIVYPIPGQTQYQKTTETAWWLSKPGSPKKRSLWGPKAPLLVEILFQLLRIPIFAQKMDLINPIYYKGTFMSSQPSFPCPLPAKHRQKHIFILTSAA